MAAQALIHAIACEILVQKDLPLDLRNYLDDIEMYANLVGGSIQSRQIVALALVNYMDHKALLGKIKELEERLEHEE